MKYWFTAVFTTLPRLPCLHVWRLWLFSWAQLELWATYCESRRKNYSVLWMTGKSVKCVSYITHKQILI